jgi:hypothetical protein
MMNSEEMDPRDTAVFVLRLRGGGLINVVKNTSSKITVNSSIHLESLHLSLCSDAYSPDSSYFGMIVYEKCELNNHRIQPGYVFIKNSLTVGSHNGLINNFLSSSVYPFPKYSEGFAFYGSIRFNSSTFNTYDHNCPTNPGTAYDHSRQMNPVTKSLLDKFLRKVWIAGFFPRVTTLTIEQIENASFLLSDNLCCKNLLLNSSSHVDCVIHCSAVHKPPATVLPVVIIPHPITATAASANVKKRKRRSHLPWTKQKRRQTTQVIVKKKIIRKRRSHPCWTHKKKSKYKI